MIHSIANKQNLIGNCRSSTRLESGRDGRSRYHGRGTRAFNYPPHAAPTYRTRESVSDYPSGGVRGWIGVVLAFITFFLTGGLTRSFGVIFLNVLEEFPGNNYALVSLAPACLTTLIIGLGLATGRINRFLTLRCIALFGYLISGIALILIYFASTLTVFIFCYIIVGAGMSQSQMSTLLNVMVHFQQKRALATGISLSGMSIGAIISPPVIHIVTVYYGFKIALASWGGLIIILSPFVLLMRPPKFLIWNSWQRRSLASFGIPRGLESTRSSLPTYVQQPTELWDRMAPVEPERELQHFDAEEKEPVVDEKSAEEPTEEAAPKSDDRLGGGHDNQKDKDENKQGSVDVSEKPSTSRPVSKSEIGIRKKSKLGKRPKGDTSVERSEATSASGSDLDPIPESPEIDEPPFYWSDNVPEETDTQEEPKTTELTPSESKGGIALRHFRAKSEGRYSFTEPESQSAFILWFRKNLYLDLSLFLHPVFRIMFFSAIFGMAGYPCALIFIPPFVLEYGTNGILASLLISISSVGDLIGRGFCSWLFDLKYFPKQTLFTISMFAISIALFFPVLTNLYDPIACAAFLYGISGGLFIVAVPILLANYHGSERLSYTYGLIRIGQCVLNFITPPFAGFLRDYFYTFVYTFVFLGVMTAFGAFCSIFLPVIKGQYRRGVVSQVVASHERGEHFYTRSRRSSKTRISPSHNTEEERPDVEKQH